MTQESQFKAMIPEEFKLKDKEGAEMEFGLRLAGLKRKYEEEMETLRRQYDASAEEVKTTTDAKLA